MAQQDSQLIDSVIKNSQFDEVWYRSTYRDVAQLEAELNISPLNHYRHYGSLMQRAPNADLASDPEKFAALLLPPPESGGELLAAHELALTGAHDRAIHYARWHLPDYLHYTLDVLLANRSVANGDTAEWLNHLNHYLNHFGVAPLRLEGGDGMLMDRLYTTPVEAINDGPLVSVIMPTWNAEKTVSYAIQSILSQSWRNLELLIVDDASEDQTWSILQKFAAADHRVKIFRNAVNAGPYVSKNIAASQAKGEWITGQDSDDWAHPERLARQVRFCEEQNSTVCMSGTVRVAGNGQLVRLNKIGGFVHDGACRSAFISLMIHAQYFHDLLGAWDPVRFAADSEILRRIEFLRKGTVPQNIPPTLLMFDNPEGLTNHPVMGHSETSGVSPVRRTYRRNYRAVHARLNKYTTRYEFPREERVFSVPDEMLNSENVISNVVKAYELQGISLRRTITADVTIITTTCWSGGNASSTLDEIEFFKQRGLSVAIIHCPINSNLGRPRSPRFKKWEDIITNWSQVEKVTTDVLICRHPAVVSSHAFNHVIQRVEASDAFIVVNNSHLRATGKPVYDRKEMTAAARCINANNLTLCPISPAIRSELIDYADAAGDRLPLCEVDWTPTFDLSLYYHTPKSEMSLPFRIGRHGRDGKEKWHENPEALRKIYPEHPDFRIKILGGASQVEKRLGALPDNWDVHDFGAIEPYEYLRELDAFVYFPDTRLTEGFGRTIVEAMLAGVPVILPRTFEPTFDDLAIYSDPEKVQQIVRMLATDDAARAAYLAEVQQIATARYSSAAIARRLSGTKLSLATESAATLRLSEPSLDFKRMLEESTAGVHSRSNGLTRLAAGKWIALKERGSSHG